jgi:hypothetical protein
MRNGVGKVQVSSAGGMERLAAATADSLDVGTSQLLFDGPYLVGGRDPSYAVSPDGQRFLMMQPVQNSAAGAEVVVTLNWLDELKKRMPTK